ncbi:MAG: hypothetical protein R2756_04590 [Bacteroidales bacterium]
MCRRRAGSFLEEQAEKLNINIVGEFGDLALSSRSPVKLGDRCTVFMESDLNTFMQKGARDENLVGGLAYSIVYNYLQKVVADRRVGDRIFFRAASPTTRPLWLPLSRCLARRSSSLPILM